MTVKVRIKRNVTDTAVEGLGYLLRRIRSVSSQFQTASGNLSSWSLQPIH